MSTSFDILILIMHIFIFFLIFLTCCNARPDEPCCLSCLLVFFHPCMRKTFKEDKTRAERKAYDVNKQNEWLNKDTAGNDCNNNLQSVSTEAQ